MASPLPFDAWIQNHQSALQRPWLILGKGPSLDQAGQHDTEDYIRIALNDAAASHTAEFIHIIDLDVFSRCGDELDPCASTLIMPWMPHAAYPKYGKETTDYRISGHNLQELSSSHPHIKRFAEAGKLLFYNLADCPEIRRNPAGITVDHFSFSAPVVIDLLGRSGVRKIRTLGVDGGRMHGGIPREGTEDSSVQTSVSSKYDIQFREIAKCIRSYQLDCGPLDQQIPVKVFVGLEKEQQLAFEVLRYSITRHASITTEIIGLNQALEGATDCSTLSGNTPFSFQRFSIPALCGYAGRAIYLDSDMLVLRDIRELWQYPMHENALLSVGAAPDSGRAAQFSVMILQCDRLQWNIKEIINDVEGGKHDYHDLLQLMNIVKQKSSEIPYYWNSLESLSRETRLLHYTDMDLQPWLNWRNRNGRIWCEHLFEAIMQGAISRTFVEKEISRGHVRPSLSYQLDHQIIDPLLLPWHIRQRDTATFVPPHVMPEVLSRDADSVEPHGFKRTFALMTYAYARHGGILLRNRIRSCRQKLKQQLRLLRLIMIGVRK